MNFKQLIDRVARTTNLPELQMIQVGDAILKHFRERIEKQENSRSSFISFNSKLVPRQPAAGGKAAIPQRTFARMIITPRPREDNTPSP
jgi:hypothetical protein